jgi:glycosyl hydrolase family 123
MKKFLTTVFVCGLFCRPVSAQIEKAAIDLKELQTPQPHYLPEYTFDYTTDPARWQNEKHGLHVSFAPSDRHYFRTEVPDVTEAATWHAAGWKGERLNALILVWSPDTLEQVRFILHALAGPDGQVLDKKSFRLNMVRYVVSNYPYDATDATCDASPYKKAWLMPDRFEGFDQFDVPGRTIRPVWLSLDLPPGIASGIYRGNVEVRSRSRSAVLHIDIKVQQEILPPPHEWKYRLDLWQNPWVVAWYNHVQPWSEEHKMLLRKHLALYAGAGGKYITTYAVHSPWADNSYMIEQTMIEWIKTSNGSWKFDYHIFDEYIKLAMEMGIDKAITIYTPVPWGNRFRYVDETTGDYVYEVWAPGSAAFKNVWNAFLDDLRIHLREKGWLEKTYLGINETTLEETLAAVRAIRENSKSWKITYAGNWHKELDSFLNDYCFLYGNEPDVAQVKARAAKGFTSTYYVCCNPPKPNDFIFSPPVQGEWLSWYAAAHGYNGFLRWAYDAWPADPARDARHAIWPAGDCFLVYPGGNSCIRFEKLREGIADYEKIRILKEKTSASRDKMVKDLIGQLDGHLQTFLVEKDFHTEKIAADIEKGKKIIEELSDRLEGDRE